MHPGTDPSDSRCLSASGLLVSGPQGQTKLPAGRHGPHWHWFRRGVAAGKFHLAAQNDGLPDGFDPPPLLHYQAVVCGCPRIRQVGFGRRCRLVLAELADTHVGRLPAHRKFKWQWLDCQPLRCRAPGLSRRRSRAGRRRHQPGGRSVRTRARLTRRVRVCCRPLSPSGQRPISRRRGPGVCLATTVGAVSLTVARQWCLALVAGLLWQHGDSYRGGQAVAAVLPVQRHGSGRCSDIRSCRGDRISRRRETRPAIGSRLLGPGR